jgi:Sigma-54 interaction domain
LRLPAARFRRPEASFVAVPIVLERGPAGALAVDFPFARTHEAHFLSVVAAMVAQALRAQRAIEDERNRLLAENKNLPSELEERYDLSNIIGTSGPMRQVYEQIAQVAQTSTTVLIRGESGTGKELIAHAIHYNSPRARPAACATARAWQRTRSAAGVPWPSLSRVDRPFGRRLTALSMTFFNDLRALKRTLTPCISERMLRAR